MFRKVWSAGVSVTKTLALTLLLSVIFVAACLGISKLNLTPSQTFLFVFVYVVIYAGLEFKALLASNKNAQHQTEKPPVNQH